MKRSNPDDLIWTKICSVPLFCNKNHIKNNKVFSLIFNQYNSICTWCQYKESVLMYISMGSVLLRQNMPFA